MLRREPYAYKRALAYFGGDCNLGFSVVEVNLLLRLPNYSSSNFCADRLVRFALTTPERLSRSENFDEGPRELDNKLKLLALHAGRGEINGWAGV